MLVQITHNIQEYEYKYVCDMWQAVLATFQELVGNWQLATFKSHQPRMQSS